MNVGTYAFAQLLRVLPRTRITRAVGRLCDLELPPAVSRAVVGVYARAYKVDLDEAEPVDGCYPSFDAFFTRRLRQGARNGHAAAGTLASPADGRLDAAGSVTHDGELIVKGHPYRAEDLLGSPEEAERYIGGQYAVIYLSPRDYHRVHTPVAGRLTEVRSYPGELFPVNVISERHIPGFLVRNRRVAMAIDADDGWGRVTVVMVAAMIVGRITVTGLSVRDVPFGIHRLDPPVELERGDELGIFHLGSTVVIFVEPGRREPAVLSRALGSIRVGEPLAHGAGARTAKGDGEGIRGEGLDG